MTQSEKNLSGVEALMNSEPIEEDTHTHSQGSCAIAGTEVIYKQSNKTKQNR